MKHNYFSFQSQKMKMPYVSSETGKEFLKDRSCETVHVVDDFESYEFTDLHVNGARILGPPIILKKAEEDEVSVILQTASTLGTF